MSKKEGIEGCLLFTRMCHLIRPIVVNEVAAIYKDNGCDVIIAIGGGSVIDTAKGVNIVVSEKLIHY